MLGGADPLAVLFTSALAGLVALAALRVDEPFSRGEPLSGRRALHLAGVVAMFAMSAIAADLTLGFPRDLNVIGPIAPFFYAAMGFVAEVCFRLIPLAVLVTVLRPRGAMIWVCVVVSALVEPLFQVVLSGGFTALGFFVFAQVFLFGVFELYVFRRHGFVWMYATRLAYYFLWHVLWGAARLPLLFG